VPTLTIFTPTYNRAHTLLRVYESLRAQTSRDFCWLVVDDGSNDGTRELIAQWAPVAGFAVEYLYQENSGKHNAHNAAVARARTELFAIVDSDDELLPHAVERITTTWRNASAQERATLAGIWTLCADPDGNVVDGEFPRPVIDATLQELRYRDRMNKEMLPTFVTDVLRRHPFPGTPPGVCPYIPESYVWMRITRTHKLRFLNEPCRVYHRSDGLNVAAREEYRLGRCIVYGYLAPLANDIEWFWSYPRLFLETAVQAARYAIFSRQFRALARTLPWRSRALLVAAAPLALFLLARDRLTGRIARQLAGRELRTTGT
jgi:glycosyltransferase involved in cell wall biosynthesis